MLRKRHNFLKVTLLIIKMNVHVTFNSHVTIGEEKSFSSPPSTFSFAGTKKIKGRPNLLKPVNRLAIAK